MLFGILDFVLGVVSNLDILSHEVVFNNWMQTYVQLPLVAVLLNNIMTDSRVLQGAFVSTVALLTIGLLIGWIPQFKYQIIGNLAVFTFVFAFNSKHRLRFFYLTLCVLSILLVGSRQSFIAFVIVLFILYPRILALGIIVFLTLIRAPINISFGPFDTLQRLYVASSVSAETNNYRMDSFNYYYENSGLEPKGYSYLYDTRLLEPHNFFVEVLYSRGLLVGGLMVTFMLFISLRILKRRKDILQVLLLFVGVVPAMVSFGVHAARFFLVVLFLNGLKKNE